MNQTITEVVNAGLNCSIGNDGIINWDDNYHNGHISTDTSACPDTYPQNCYDWWNYYYYPWQGETHNHYHTSTIVHEDKGKKAIEIMKALMESKIIQIKTIKQFVDLLDRIVKVL